MEKVRNRRWTQITEIFNNSNALSAFICVHRRFPFQNEPGQNTTEFCTAILLLPTQIRRDTMRAIHRSRYPGTLKQDSQNPATPTFAPRFQVFCTSAERRTKNEQHQNAPKRAGSSPSPTPLTPHPRQPTPNHIIHPHKPAYSPL